MPTVSQLGLKFSFPQGYDGTLPVYAEQRAPARKACALSSPFIAVVSSAMMHAAANFRLEQWPQWPGVGWLHPSMAQICISNKWLNHQGLCRFGR
jgi:hypothetical protein